MARIIRLYVHTCIVNCNNLRNKNESNGNENVNGGCAVMRDYDRLDKIENGYTRVVYFLSSSVGKEIKKEYIAIIRAHREKEKQDEVNREACELLSAYRNRKKRRIKSKAINVITYFKDIRDTRVWSKR